MYFRRDVSATKKKHAFLSTLWNAMLTRRTQSCTAHKLDAGVIALPDRFLSATGTLLPVVFFAESIAGYVRLAFACPSAIPTTGNNGLIRSTHLRFS
jgi:hypothetical protein